MKYRSRTIVEARQLQDTEESHNEMVVWVWRDRSKDPPLRRKGERGLVLRIGSSDFAVRVGDWIALDQFGQGVVIANSLFASMYEPVPDDARQEGKPCPG